MDKNKYSEYALRIFKELGVEKPEMENHFVINEVSTVTRKIGVVEVKVKIAVFDNEKVRIDIDFQLPNDGVLAERFMDYCAVKEGTPKNHHGQYSSGPRYKHWQDENTGKLTFALSPWRDNFFYVRSENYSTDQIEEAVNDVVSLSSQFTRHIGEYLSLKFWKKDDAEVMAKAKEIIANAALQETDCDRETRGHWLVDKNSFIKGWFFPFNDKGKGTFDTVWPSSLDYAASNIGKEGSFEYAVACVVLEDDTYIKKAKDACRIRKETVTRFF